MRCLRLALLVSLVVNGGPLAADDAQQSTDFFENKIRPVLVQHCYECHAADSKKLRGGLRLDDRESTRRGGDSGPAVVPGDLDESLLLSALEYESFEMPPTGKLPQSVIDDFKTWIETGATDPRDVVKSDSDGSSHVAGIDFEAGRQFWSFRPPQRHPVPQPHDAAWSDSDIDRFLLAKMEDAGLTPSPDADRRTLIRRAYFDLIGLPPPPERIAAFLDDPSSTLEAFARVVDELLDSQHFGERWGRHWLDLARFAESTGGGRSLLYGHSWRYRDYVINAFNTDKPFDQFIIEQLAGDLLPVEDYQTGQQQLTATAFLALGPTNYELQDKEQLRMDVIDEQIDTMGRAFLAMTLGCVRCHDHKFDPIPTTDYYALAGIFRSTKTMTHANVSNWITQPLPVDPQWQQELDDHATALAGLKSGLKSRSTEAEEIRKQLPLTRLDDVDAKIVSGEWSSSNGVKKFVGDGYHYASAPNHVMEFRLTLEHPGTYEVRASYSPHANRSPNAPFTITHRDGETEVRVDQQKPPAIEGLYASLGQFTFDSEAIVTVSTEGATGTVIADAVEVVPVKLEPANAEDGGSDVQRFAELIVRFDDLKSEISDLESQIAEHEKQTPPQPPQAVVVTEEDAKEIGDYHVCIRGNAKNPGPTVPRGFLSVATIDSDSELPTDTSGRLQLAQWIASEDNPLTARVAVNRIWQQLFGVGLVRTVDNFGVAGEKPSHPELLDHLALTFVDRGWSVKSHIREIMLSRAYRLSCDASPEVVAVDPEDRLLSHQRRQRLEAESIYDAILSLSGSLDVTIGGDTIRSDTTSEYGYEFDVGRRAVYLPVFRNRLPDLFTVFDFPDPNLSTGRRNVSTLSTQALLLMNSPFVAQQARLTAERLLAETELDDDQRLSLLYHRAVGRPPTSDEAELARSFLSDNGQLDEEQRRFRWTGLCQAVIASLDFRYVE